MMMNTATVARVPPPATLVGSVLEDPMAADVSARLAWPDDAPSIARIQAEHWRETYGSLLNEEAIDAVDLTEMSERWVEVITRANDARLRTLVALDVATVRGFALVHASHDPDADQVVDGELGEFIIAADHRTAGHGSRLLQACADTLRADGFRRAVWWVTSSDDKTRAFAEAAGWAPDGAHRELEGDAGQRLKQIRLHTALM